MSNAENYSEKLAPHVLDSEWLAMSIEEQVQADPDRYFKAGWNESLLDAKQQVAEELARDREREQEYLSRRNLGARVMGFVSRIPRHRA